MSITESLTDEQLLDLAAKATKYGSISIGEYEPTTGSAVEAYGSELIAFARAAIAADRAANSTTQENQTVEQLKKLLFLLTPVIVSEQPWKQDGWCDPVTGKCWIQSWQSDDVGGTTLSDSTTWYLQLPISKEEIENGRAQIINYFYPKGKVDRFTIFYGYSLPYNSPFASRPQLTHSGEES